MQEALTLGGCICPSQFHMHLGSFEPLVCSVVPQLEAPSVDCLSSPQNPVPMGH